MVFSSDFSYFTAFSIYSHYLELVRRLFYVISFSWATYLLLIIFMYVRFKQFYM